MQTQDTITIRKGGGVISLCGLPFLVFGMFAISSPLSGLMADKHGSPPPWFFIVPFGLISALVGGVLVFGRTGTVLDRRARIVTSWWGLLVPFKKTTRSLNDFQAVTVSHEIRQSKNSTYSVYPVRLEGDTDKLNIEEPRDYQQARCRAEEIAKFIGFGIVDRSSGEAVVRDADVLDQSLRDRSRRADETISMPPMPVGCRVETSNNSNGETVFSLPSPGFKPIHAIPLVIGFGWAAMGCIFVMPIFLRGGTPPFPMNLLVIGFLLFWTFGPLLFMVPVMLRSVKTRETILISSRQLRLEQKRLVGKHISEIALDKLEELEIKHGGVIVARSDKQTLEFGDGLSREELQWLQDAIHAVVVATPQ